MTKSELRQQFRAMRSALPPAEIADRSQKITERLVAFLSEHFTDQSFRLHTFLPIERQREVNTWLIVNALWKDFSQVTVAVPVTDMTTGQMNHVRITAETTFTQNQLGIPEPVGMKNEELVINSVDFDVILVPLLAVDRTGQRVGYGGGFYDRFLAQCRPDCLKIGLSLFAPVDSISDVWAGDVRLDGCVMPDRLYESEPIG